ncbi:MAG: hypothetical protein LBM12_02815 [Candidatus Nomurabacteria bacterium]|jgi:hypothetical protein|nr:hypothetical protein [Candidatus Nomurabacteria bacterium]
MGKCVKTLVVTRQIGVAHCADEGDVKILRELERATVKVAAKQKVVAERVVPGRSRNPLERVRNRCVRELKGIFATYLSGDYMRDDNSPLSLGQIKTIGELVDGDLSDGVLGLLR